MLDLKTQCPELLHRLPGFPNDGTGTALEDILKSIRNNQKPLRAKLGFDEGQDTLDQPIETDLNKTFRIIPPLISALLPPEERETADIFENKLKSGMKVTRAIQRRVGAGEHLVDLMAHMTKYKIYGYKAIKSELPKFPDQDGFAILKDPMTLVQNFYSEIAALKGKSIGITLDPLMFIRGTNAHAYSSCYNIGNINSAAPITLGLSGSVAMIYSRDAASILGRCWVIINPDYKSFFVMKSYGFLNKETIEAACGWLCTLLNPTATWYVNNRIDMSLCVSMTEQGIYGDPIQKFYSCDLKDGVANYSPYMVTTTSRCIICGKSHGNSHIICPDCERMYIVRCARCGSPMFRDSKHTVHLCSKCIGSKVVCPDCGSVHDADKTCSCKVSVNECTFCGKPSIVSYHGISMCADCASIIHTADTCEACGNKGVMYPYNGHAVCQTCFTYLSREDYRIPSGLPNHDKLVEMRG